MYMYTSLFINQVHSKIDSKVGRMGEFVVAQQI